MNYCENCGCRTNNGICSNCQEELYILMFQDEYIEYPISDEFIIKATKQFNETIDKLTTKE